MLEIHSVSLRCKVKVGLIKITICRKNNILAAQSRAILLARLHPSSAAVKPDPTSKKGARMSIDIDTARKVAKLARIRVEEADLPALAGELSGILGFMEQLNEVDVEGVEPMTSVTPMRLRRRADVVTDGNIQGQILKNAPDAREGFFAVPKVVE